MPKIFPFRATHFALDRVGDLSKVVTQPYDKIDAALQDEYYRRHEHNVVRLIRRKDEPGDSAGMAKYPAAASTLREWITSGILVEDPSPAFYAYHQTYRTPQGDRTRKGFVAMVRAEEFGKGRVHPHEETHSEPKVDRHHLLTHTRTHFGQVFLLYSDPERKVGKLLDDATRREPDLQAVDDFGERHRAWRISDPKAMEAIQRDLERRDAIIADGHHRYETAVRFHQEMKARGARCEGAESHENVMATLVNMDDEGLTIYPTHRVVGDLPSFDPDRLRQGASKLFEVREYPFAGPEEERSARQELLEDLAIEGLSRPAFGVALAGVSSYYLYLLPSRKTAAALVKEKKSEEWRSLDVNVLHTVILEGLLGVGKAQLEAERNVVFVRHAGEAIRLLSDPRYRAAFLVNPVRVDQIRAIVRKGERFPQKTTDFYPKMLTGLLLCRLHFTEE